MGNNCLDEDLDVKDLDTISKRPPWFDLHRNGGGDIDLVDWDLDYKQEEVPDYQNIP